MVEVILAKYLTKDNFLDMQKLANAFIIWKCILDHRYLVEKGINWSLVNDARINFL